MTYPSFIKILLLSHCETLTAMVRQAFSQLNSVRTHVIEVDHLDAAKHQIANTLFDCILLDIQDHAKHSFYELDTLVLEAPTISLICLISSDHPNLATQCLDRGGTDFLIKKPWEEDFLKRVIRYNLFYKKNKEKMLQLLQHDELTGVANRHLLLDRLSQALLRSERSGFKIAVLFIDIDNFSHINELFGYQAGDVILKETASRLIDCLRKQDTVSRFGSDEFILILEGLSDIQHVINILQELKLSLEDPIFVQTQSLYISTSIGISILDDHASVIDALDLIKQADIARYRAKEKGKNTFHFYTEKYNQMAEKRELLQHQLQETLSRIFKAS